MKARKECAEGEETPHSWKRLATREVATVKHWHPHLISKKYLTGCFHQNPTSRALFSFAPSFDHPPDVQSTSTPAVSTLTSHVVTSFL